MKRNIGFGILLILNITFVWLVSFTTIIRFALIVVPMGAVMGNKIADDNTMTSLSEILIFVVTALPLNYIIFLKLVVNKKPGLMSLITTAAGVLICGSVLWICRLGFY